MCFRSLGMGRVGRCRPCTAANSLACCLSRMRCRCADWWRLLSQASLPECLLAHQHAAHSSNIQTLVFGVTLDTLVRSFSRKPDYDYCAHANRPSMEAIQDSDHPTANKSWLEVQEMICSLSNEAKDFSSFAALTRSKVTLTINVIVHSELSGVTPYYYSAGRCF